MDIQDSPISAIKAGKTFWLYSKRGPGDNSSHGPYRLSEGVIPFPVVGEIARGLVAKGLRALDASQCRIVGWPDSEPVGGWRPLLGSPDPEPEVKTETKVIVRDIPAELVDGLPDLSEIASLPAKLPDAYRRLFGCYTASGKLRSRYDW